MELRLRQLRAGEPDWELLWLAVTAAAAAGAVAWLSLNLPWPQCNWRAILGIPCATCGSTRALLALAHGQFFEAWRWNPLATVALCAVAVFDVYALVVLSTRAKRLRVTFRNAAQLRALLALLAAAGLLNWLYLLRHV